MIYFSNACKGYSNKIRTLECKGNSNKIRTLKCKENSNFSCHVIRMIKKQSMTILPSRFLLQRNEFIFLFFVK